MVKNSTSFQPGQSGNPGGRPKRVRTLATLIDSLSDEACSGMTEDYRTATIRRLWDAAATGKLGQGKTAKALNAREWLALVQWLVSHMDKVAIEQWDVRGNMPFRREPGPYIGGDNGPDEDQEITITPAQRQLVINRLDVVSGTVAEILLASFKAVQEAEETGSVVHVDRTPTENDHVAHRVINTMLASYEGEGEQEA